MLWTQVFQGTNPKWKKSDERAGQIPVSTRYLWGFLVYYESRCSKFIQPNCELFVCWELLSSRNLRHNFHGLFLTDPYFTLLTATEIKWLMELITAANKWHTKNKFPFIYYPSFRTLFTFRYTDSSVKCISPSQPAAHRSPWSAKPWNRSTK
jgi:hypothetical protein